MKVEQISLFGSRELQAYSAVATSQQAKLTKESLNLVVLFEDVEIDWGFDEREINKIAHEVEFMRIEEIKRSDAIRRLSHRYKRKEIEIELLLLHLKHSRKLII